MDPEAYYDLTLIDEVAASPGGDRAAFVAREFDPGEDERRSSLFVVPADGSEPPHRLTRVGDARHPRWSPDGSKLGFLAAREEDSDLRVGRPDEEGGDGERSQRDEAEPERQVWAFDLERGGDARQLTALDEGVREFDWAPDGDRLVVSARDPTEEERDYLDRREEGGPIETERLQHKYDGRGWLDSVRTHLFVVDATTREERRLDDAWDRSYAEAAGGLQPRWGPGGSVAFRANRDEEPDDSRVADLYTIDPDGGGLARHTGSDLTVTAPRWGPDGDRIAFVGADPVNLYVPGEVYVCTPGEGEARSVSGDLDRPVARRGSAEWLDGETLLAPVGDEGCTRLVRFHADGSAPDRVFSAQGDDRTATLFDLAGGTVGVVLSHPSEGADLHALGTDAIDAGVEPVRLTRVNADLLGTHDGPACERITYPNESGDAIEAFVYLPPGFDPDDPDALPTVVVPHGGPVAYDAPRFRFDDLLFTNRGYAVLRPNYRGSSSYGRAFSEAIRGDWGPRETEDVLAGVDAMVERGWADPDRLFVTGFSYGGMATAYAVAASDCFAAAATEHGVYDYRSAFGTDDEHAWWEADFGLPWEEPEAYDRASSITDVGGIDTPLLVTAGGEDWRCPPTQAEQLYVSVRKRGVPAKLVVYPGEHHDIGDPDRAIHRLKEIAGWFEEHDPIAG